MIRLLARPLGAGLILLAAQINGANEVFPVVHNEPITIRVLSGRDGHPLAKAHLTMVAGYNQRDLDLRMRREEALTDALGVARLPNALANFPLLQVSIAKEHLCQGNGREAIFSIERIRRDGLSAPNRCGTPIVQDAPGLFTVWVKTGKAAPDPFAPTTVAPQTAAQAAALVPTPTSAPVPATAAAPICPVALGPAVAPSPPPAHNRRKHLPPLARA
jgi:hypothetical protein